MSQGTDLNPRGSELNPDPYFRGQRIEEWNLKFLESQNFHGLGTSLS